MLTPAQLREALKPYSASLIVHKTGLSISTVAQFKRGVHKDPRFSTYAALVEFLESENLK